MIRLLVASCAYLTLVIGLDSNCDFYQVISPSQSFYVTSAGYPNKYPGGIICRWIVNCGNNTCKADCDDIDLPSSPDCNLDSILISRRGNELLDGAEKFCGKGSTSVTSTGGKLSIGLVTSENSPGGKFRCTLTAVPLPPTLPPISCSCGYHKSNRIVGGTQTGEHEFPMMAGIIDLGGNVRCGGTIIDKRYILTAAHCMKGADLTKLQVLVGGHNTEQLNPSSKIVNIDGYLIHSDYNENSNANDVALLLLAEDLTFNSNVGPVCLPFYYPDSANGKLTALGWGTQSFGGPTSDTLEKVNLDVISDSECRQRGGNPTSSQFCTYTPNKDTCQLDSGGPLLKTNNLNGLLYLSGVISLGQYCGTENPALNTDVNSVLGWIEKNTKNAKFCKK